MVQVVIQEDGREQAQLEGAAGLKLPDDLPGREILLVGVGADEVEVELKRCEPWRGSCRGFDQAMDGFDLSLEGVSGGGCGGTGCRLKWRESR